MMLIACAVIVVWWGSLYLAIRIGCKIGASACKKQIWALLGAAENMAARKRVRRG